MDFVALKAELDTDPLGRGYSGMTDEQAAVDLNTVYRTRNRDTMTGREVMDAFDGNGSEWDALTAANQDRIISLCGRDDLNPFGQDSKIFQDAAAGASSTISALATARVENISRGEELNLGQVSEGNVAFARSE